MDEHEPFMGIQAAAAYVAERVGHYTVSGLKKQLYRARNPHLKRRLIGKSLVFTPGELDEFIAHLSPEVDAQPEVETD